MNTYKNQPIVYDKEIISRIKEMIDIGLNKLKSFKTKQTNNLKFYYDLKKRFKEIELNLKELRLDDELYYFCSVTHYVKYIVYKNSIDPSFGYCPFAVELLNFYVEYLKTNFDYYLNLSDMSHKDFEIFQTEIKHKHGRYRSRFHTEIYVPSGQYTEEEMYEIHASLRK